MDPLLDPDPLVEEIHLIAGRLLVIDRDRDVREFHGPAQADREGEAQGDEHEIAGRGQAVVDDLQLLQHRRVLVVLGVVHAGPVEPDLGLDPRQGVGELGAVEPVVLGLLLALAHRLRLRVRGFADELLGVVRRDAREVPPDVRDPAAEVVEVHAPTLLYWLKFPVYQ